MKNYAESTDKQFAKEIIESAPQQSKAWLNFDKEVHDTQTAIPAKYKELISIGIALTTQCPYCIEVHTLKAKEIGITQEELSETIMIAAALRSGAAVGYGLLHCSSFIKLRSEKLFIIYLFNLV